MLHLHKRCASVLLILFTAGAQSLMGATTSFTVTGAQQTFTAVLAVPNPAASFVMVATNGDVGGLHRVQSGTISINGAPVVSTKELTRDVATVRRNVSLQASNTVGVSV